jgi:LEA14-like dessication related protein
MRNISLLVISMLAVVGCSAPKTPDFKKMKNVRVSNVNGNVYSVAGDAIYNNPNSIGGNLVGMEMDISVDEIEVTHISQTKSAVIQPETDFSVPIVFDVDVQKVLGENEGLLGGLLKKLVKDEIDITYKGHLEVEFLGTSFKVPVDYTEAVSVGLNFD